ncbi:MAG: hypothetical protein HC843_00315 [Sphingomonadales bacterium]|nr:hypothetical protein [Sphingomonadales bacterium]
MKVDSDKISLQSQLVEILKPACITNCKSRDWCSATFHGYQLRYDMILKGSGRKACADGLSDILTDHDFALDRHFVADIGVEDRSDHDTHISMAVTLLLIAD